MSSVIVYSPAQCWLNFSPVSRPSRSLDVDVVVQSTGHWNRRQDPVTDATQPFDVSNGVACLQFPVARDLGMTQEGRVSRVVPSFRCYCRGRTRLSHGPIHRSTVAAGPLPRSRTTACARGRARLSLDSI